MSSLYETGVRPYIDKWLQDEAAKVRDYGPYWSASQAGYCHRLNILKRLNVPCVPEIEEDAMRTQRVFSAGHAFHRWYQGITEAAGVSIAQELELQDEDLMVRGHIDDLVLINGKLILYDAKTANSQAFNYKRDEMGWYHKMQLGTYMYMLRQKKWVFKNPKERFEFDRDTLTEGRILTISKDDLRLREQQLMWSPDLEKEVVEYWRTLQGHWRNKTLPKCTCLDHDGGFMGRRSKKGKVYNNYFLNDVPCSQEWVKDKLPEGWKI